MEGLEEKKQKGLDEEGQPAENEGKARPFPSLANSMSYVVPQVFAVSRLISPSPNPFRNGNQHLSKKFRCPSPSSSPSSSPSMLAPLLLLLRQASYWSYVRLAVAAPPDNHTQNGDLDRNGGAKVAKSRVREKNFLAKVESLLFMQLTTVAFSSAHARQKWPISIASRLELVCRATGRRLTLLRTIGIHSNGQDIKIGSTALFLVSVFGCLLLVHRLFNKVATL
ncbi:hypothetical protein B0T10DRAFT_69486 [Thelonectria olida]|uniref:Uncharacterized protein n=1 Tax=Thelonectria olida TaxID=1576542 RepID=A0A9P8W517_9HYPO|nr:hypothetical protein B0T10DRAFT_69486 [Thelonectria olida]